MKSAPIPDNDQERLQLLRSYKLLDTPPEEEFDGLVRLASFVAQTPIALVSLVDEDRQWFKARVGLGASETARDISFCGHAVAKRTNLVVPDTLKDPRFADNPLVTADPSIRYYSGRLIGHDANLPLGTLCVIDRVPRKLTDEQNALLDVIAAQASSLLASRAAALALARQGAESDAVFRASIDPICVASFDGYFTRLNPAWRSVMGYDIETMLAAPFAEFIHPDDLPRVEQVTAELRLGGELRHFDVRFRTADGSYRWLQFNASGDPDRQAYIAVARDVTQKRADAAALDEARRQAESANRAKSAFLANMSHELRTPLNSVIGFANILRRNKDGTLDAKQLDYLERIHRNGKHLLSLLNDVLDLSKVESGRVDLSIESVDVHDLLMEVHEIVGPSEPDRSSRVDLRLDAPEDLRPIATDRLRLAQIMTNLIANALKFTSAGTVTTRVSADAAGNVGRIDVIDTGIGMSAEDLRRAFEPFEQAESGPDRRFEGTGLGLAISRSLAVSMDMSLTAVSEVGRGSTFSLLLPDGESQAPVHTSEQAPVHTSERTDGRPIPRPGRGCVLIVDDDVESRLLLESTVSELGLSVVALDSAEFALQTARLVRPRAVLLDLMMPGVDGFTLLDQFGADPELADIPITVVSVVGTENRSRLGHATDVLDKPVDLETLSQVLQRRLQRRPRVLVVSSDAAARSLASIEVEHASGCAVEAADAAEAERHLREQACDAVVIDLEAPAQSYDFLNALVSNSRRDLPVIIFANSQGRTPREAAQLSELAGVLREAFRREVAEPMPRGEKLHAAQQKLRPRYLSRLRDTVARLEEIVVDDDLDAIELKRIAHNLRGSGASYGFSGVSDAAAAVADADGDELRHAGHALIAQCRIALHSE